MNRRYKDWDETILNCKCDTIKELCVNSWDNWSERSWLAAFNKWTHLTSLSLIGWEFSRALDMSHFLLNCPRLRNFTFNGSIVLSNMDKLNERANSLQLQTLTGDNISIHQSALIWLLLNCRHLCRLKCDSIVDLKDLDPADPILSQDPNHQNMALSLTHLRMKSIPAPNVFLSHILPKIMTKLRHLNLTITNLDSQRVDPHALISQICSIGSNLQALILMNEIYGSNPKSVIKIPPLILNLRNLRHLELNSFEIDESLIKRLRRSMKYLDYLSLT